MNYPQKSHILLVISLVTPHKSVFNVGRYYARTRLVNTLKTRMTLKKKVEKF